MSLNKPKVVVVMPAYNAAKTLPQTYQEVRDQQLVDAIILVDDGSRDDTAAAFAYGGASWVAAGAATGGTGASNSQVYQAVQWPQAGIALATGSTTAATGGAGIAMFDAADLASGTACTISNAYGCFVYNDSITGPVSKQGVCFNNFGTGAAVTNGTFTIQWSANGVWRVT